MARVEWKSFDVVSVGKIFAAIWAIIGFLYGLVFALFASMFAGMPGVGGMAVGFGIAAIIILPIVFAFIGFVAGVIGAFIYNIVAARVGGIVVNT